MKKTIIVSALMLLGMQSFLLSSNSLTGEDIARQVHNANRSTKGIIVKGEMTMKDLSRGSSESRQVVILSFREDNLSRSMIRFTDSSYRGTTMLTMERKERDNLQYLYLPTVGSARQIEGSDREKNFVDTDFSNEDLGGARIEDYTYKRLSDLDTPGGSRYVIERYPKSNTSAYSKHIVVIDKETLIPLNVRFFSRSGRVVKTISAGDIIRISNNIYIPETLKVVDIENRRETELKVQSAEEKMLNRGYFNRNRMNMRWAEE